MLNEKSLNRLLNHMKEHDCGIMTAYRSKKPDGTPYTKKENQLRNKALSSSLLKEGYGVTSVLGKYAEGYGTEDEVWVTEHSFFVVDLKDKGNLPNVLFKLAEKFDQDSIFLCNHNYPGREGEITIYLEGTARGEWPGYKDKVFLKNFDTEKGNFYTLLRNTPFRFTEALEIEEVEGPTGMSRQFLNKWINRDVYNMDKEDIIKTPKVFQKLNNIKIDAMEALTISRPSDKRFLTKKINDFYAKIDSFISTEFSNAKGSKISFSVETKEPTILIKVSDDPGIPKNYMLLALVGFPKDPSGENPTAKIRSLIAYTKEGEKRINKEYNYSKSDNQSYDDVNKELTAILKKFKKDL